MIQLQSVAYEVAGRRLFQHISFNFQKKRYGLVGANGIGKSTLAQLMSGLLRPSSGHVWRQGSVGYLRQSEDPPSIPVAEYLLDVWEAVEVEMISRLLEGIDFERLALSLSGGEWVKVRLAKLLAQNPAFVVLDEPTNNLDEQGRQWVMSFVQSYRQGLVLISHDRDLLAGVDTILELSNRGLSEYGGGFDFYWQQRQAEDRRQDEALVKSKIRRQKAKEERVEKLDRQNQRMRQGAKAAEKGGMPRILLGARKRQAEKSWGRLDVQETRIVDESREEVDRIWSDGKTHPFIRFNFAHHQPPDGKVHLSAQDLNFQYSGSSRSLWAKPLSFQVQGSQRWWVRGSNGSGKSTLVRLILGEELRGKQSGNLTRGNSAIAYLDQKYGQLMAEQTVLENLQLGSRFSVGELRNELAFFGFQGDQVHIPVSNLSGGQLMKAALAKAVLSQQLPSVMILDEPTNNLDLQSQEYLMTALREFSGALLVITHDHSFAQGVGLTRELILNES